MKGHNGMVSRREQEDSDSQELPCDQDRGVGRLRDALM